VVLSYGEQLNAVLVIEPTTTAWMHYSPREKSARLDAFGANFQDFIHRLENEQMHYDLAAEKTLQEFGRVETERLAVGERAYRLVVLPPGTENLDGPTVALLREDLERGGRVLAWQEPSFVDGRESEEVRALAARSGDAWVRAADDEMGFRAWRDLGPPSVSFMGLGEADLLFHQVREFAGGRFIFLVNTHPVREPSARLTVAGRSVEAWDAFTGDVRPYPFVRNGDQVKVDVRLPVAGSLLLCVRDRRQGAPASAAAPAVEQVPASGTLAVRRLNPTSSPSTIATHHDGKTSWTSIFTKRSADLPRSRPQEQPWDSAVQYKRISLT
jgi:hypothetical protein